MGVFIIASINGYPSTARCRSLRVPMLKAVRPEGARKRVGRKKWNISSE